MPDSENSRLVYSTGIGRVRDPNLCERCGAPTNECRCPQQRTSRTNRADGVVRIALDRKHRRGKVMTLVTGAPGDGPELAQTLRELKKLLATGGAMSDGQLELQGDHATRVAAYFAERGIKTKHVGG
jgi:translation initiation factor 1